MVRFVVRSGIDFHLVDELNFLSVVDVDLCDWSRSVHFDVNTVTGCQTYTYDSIYKPPIQNEKFINSRNMPYSVSTNSTKTVRSSLQRRDWWQLDNISRPSISYKVPITVHKCYSAHLNMLAVHNSLPEVY